MDGVEGKDQGTDANDCQGRRVVNLNALRTRVASTYDDELNKAQPFPVVNEFNYVSLLSLLDHKRGLSSHHFDPFDPLLQAACHRVSASSIAQSCAWRLQKMM